MSSPLPDCGRPYLSLCTPARLLRHTPRKTKTIITIPIIATPSFMPSQTESSESTVHQPFPRRTNASRFVRMPNPVEQS